MKLFSIKTLVLGLAIMVSQAQAGIFDTITNLKPESEALLAATTAVATGYAATVIATCVIGLSMDLETMFVLTSTVGLATLMTIKYIKGPVKQPVSTQV